MAERLALLWDALHWELKVRSITLAALLILMAVAWLTPGLLEGPDAPLSRTISLLSFYIVGMEVLGLILGQMLATPVLSLTFTVLTHLADTSRTSRILFGVTIAALILYGAYLS